jgi:hypothetical protein
MAKAEKPFNKIVMTRAALDMYVEHGEAALQGRSHAEFIAEIREAFGYLMDFRNIINGMVRFDDVPREAVLPYLDE